MSDVIGIRTAILEPMCFSIVKENEDASESNVENEEDNITGFKHYIQFKKKNYTKNGVEKTLIQIIDISQTILYEQVHAENQFLAITNATVSHELRNPLQSITSQNLKINLCIKELLNILRTDQQNDSVKKIKKNIKQVVDMI